MLLFHFDFNFLNPRVDYLHAWIDRLADLGYTGIVWELEDKVQWQTCPECVWPEAMSREELQGLLAHARERGMTNIPLLQTIGHAEYVLKHEPYIGWRENPERHDCYCTSRPEVRAFLARWIAEYLEIFGEIEHFHLGGDEAYQFASCEVCKAAAEATSRNALYAEHIRELAAPIQARGIKPGIWCDMVLHHPEQMDAIPADIVIWDWNYWDGTAPRKRGMVWGQGFRQVEDVSAETRAAYPDMITADGLYKPFYTSDFLRDQGREVIVCSATRSSGDSLHCGRQDEHSPNVAVAAQKAVRSGLAGTLVTSWAIRLSSFETQYPWIVLAALAYRQPEADYDDLLAQVAADVFGLPDASVFTMMRQVGTPVPFARRHESGIQFNGLKDPVLPPDGYIETWLTDERRESMVADMTAAMTAIAEGTLMLADLRTAATRGEDILDAWATAADRQAGSLMLAISALGPADDLARGSARWLLLRERAAVAQAYAGWQTPESAVHTATLAYSALTGWL